MKLAECLSTTTTTSKSQRQTENWRLLKHESRQATDAHCFLLHLLPLSLSYIDVRRRRLKEILGWDFQRRSRGARIPPFEAPTEQIKGGTWWSECGRGENVLRMFADVLMPAGFWGIFWSKLLGFLDRFWSPLVEKCLILFVQQKFKVTKHLVAVSIRFMMTAR